MKIRLFIICSLYINFILNSCHQNENPGRESISIFFNPAGNYHVQQFEIKILLGKSKKYLVDTLINTSKISNYIPLTSFILPTNEEILEISINVKDTTYRFPVGQVRSIYLSYDDHTIMSRKLYEIESKVREKNGYPRNLDLTSIYLLIRNNWYSHNFDRIIIEQSFNEDYGPKPLK